MLKAKIGLLVRHGGCDWWCLRHEARGQMGSLRFAATVETLEPHLSFFSVG